MTSDTHLGFGDASAGERRLLGNAWGYLLALGIALIVLGTLAILAPFIVTQAILIMFGILLAAAGFVQIAATFWTGLGGRFFLHLLFGILYLVAGVVMIKHPVEAAALITFLLAVIYMAGGGMRIAVAFALRGPGAGWILLNGFITLGLGILIWSQWPFDSLWIIGLFVGIDMLFAGWSWVMIALAVRPSPNQGTTPPFGSAGTEKSNSP